MAKDWPKRRLGDVLPFRYGKALAENNRDASGSVPVFGSNGVVGSHSSALIDSSGVVIGRKGSVGKVHFSGAPFWPIDTSFFVVGSDEVDIRFAYYLLQTLGLDEMNSDSAVPGLNRESAHAVPVALPPLLEQRAIAEVLGALDDKIESNRRIVSSVDGLLRAEVEQATALDPDARICNFGDLVTRINVGVNPERLSGAVPYIGLEHMPRGSVVLDEWGDSEGLGSGKAKFNEKDILFGKLRPYFKKVGVAPVGGICSTDILVLRASKETPLSVALAVAASDELIDYASAASTGTRMPRVSWEYLASFQTEVPGPARMQSLGRRLDPLLELATGLVGQNRSLAATRDTLLPALLSGRIRVPFAAELVEA